MRDFTKGHLAYDKSGINSLPIFEARKIVSATLGVPVDVTGYMAFRVCGAVGYKFGAETIYAPLLQGQASGCSEKDSLTFDANVVIELM